MFHFIEMKCVLMFEWHLTIDRSNKMSVRRLSVTDNKCTRNFTEKKTQPYINATMSFNISSNCRTQFKWNRPVESKSWDDYCNTSNHKNVLGRHQLKWPLSWLNDLIKLYHIFNQNILFSPYECL